MADDQPIVPPPNDYTVEFERKPVLYRADGTALYRRAGFAMQTTGTFPETTKRTPKKSKKR